MSYDKITIDDFAKLEGFDYSGYAQEPMSPEESQEAFREIDDAAANYHLENGNSWIME